MDVQSAPWEFAWRLPTTENLPSVSKIMKYGYIMQLFVLKWLFASYCETSLGIQNTLNPYCMHKTIAIERQAKLSDMSAAQIHGVISHAF